MAIEPRREAILVVNQLSRRGFLGTEPLKEALERHGVHVRQAFPVRSPRRIPSLIREAVNGGVRLVVVGGGDGTIAAAVDPLAHTSTALGILPLGTGNDFARALGIPLDLDGACQVIAGGKVAGVNLGQANGDYFANATSIGFSARISHRATGWLKRFFGIGAYVLGAFMEYWRYHAFHATLVVDGNMYEITTSLVAVWNGRFHAGWDLMPATDKAKQHKLLVYAPATPRRLGLLLMALSLRMGHLVEAPPLLALEGETVSIEAHPPQDVDVDGEILGRTPLTVRLVPGALKVLVPQTFQE